MPLIFPDNLSLTSYKNLIQKLLEIRDFQGTCADQSVLCEQLCIATATFTYECACWDNHVLIEDGISCIG